ncbi:phage integrase N-terminal SAM-like domain-containing protein [Methanohalophilus portucalensis]|uniref:Phage integrase, N-terminal SAM-like domain n=2 Tax=Methanohalophilus portucalensis TaxID=39664 RepID=A0A1L9C2R0_9EURY|nr:phage integrase N-terminal SAM-like domain-containing protein [Methanohalophilus portucalensis]ATU08039.1 hypothetical protein BKM01_04155 [Methanohalophilus portucalensis]OJH48761.1 hypothetical protein MPF_1808 [Methanohalophilus portucalensis FDF-1]RNI12240.1 hypothetical protein EFE41_03795 [Methanohalophilus portucalensis FDF-1]SMH43195.1 Phage integrase, N-terminal SAM-like domain [Methanohalophilus portucalensis FDF-1]
MNNQNKKVDKRRNKDHLKYKINGKCVDEYESCKEWIESKKSINTRKNYKSTLQIYVKFTGKTPDELIDEALDELDDKVIIQRQKHIRYIRKFKNYLINERNSSEKTVNQRLRCIHNFYKYYDIPISENVIAKKTNKKDGNNERLTYEDIKNVLENYAGENPLIRAYILVAVSTGMASDDITKLTVGDV